MQAVSGQWKICTLQTLATTQVNRELFEKHTPDPNFH